MSEKRVSDTTANIYYVMWKKMGVYVFRCLRAPYIKVGHHLVRPRRPNAYYRIAGRGFESVVHPIELDGKLWPDDLELVAWYPNLTRDDERDAHRLCTTRVGEFHESWEMDAVLALCDARGARCEVDEAARKRAMAWGARRVRRAKKVRVARQEGRTRHDAPQVPARQQKGQVSTVRHRVV